MILCLLLLGIGLAGLQAQQRIKVKRLPIDTYEAVGEDEEDFEEPTGADFGTARTGETTDTDEPSSADAEDKEGEDSGEKANPKCPNPDGNGNSRMASSEPCDDCDLTTHYIDGCGTCRKLGEVAPDKDGDKEPDECDECPDFAGKKNSCEECAPEPKEDGVHYVPKDAIPYAKEISPLIKEMMETEEAKGWRFVRGAGKGGSTIAICGTTGIGFRNTFMDAISMLGFELSHVINKEARIELVSQVLTGKISKDEYLNKTLELEAEGHIIQDNVMKQMYRNASKCMRKGMTKYGNYDNKDHSDKSLSELRETIRNNGELEERIRQIKEGGNSGRTGKSIITHHEESYGRLKNLRDKYLEMGLITDEQILEQYKKEKCKH